MPPDFNKKTIDTLAKRAAFLCSNPDCRVSTVGPNSDPIKATVIGEAAHIFGARPSAKRYNSEMSDIARAEITNAIWICRNCHKLVDTDALKYSSDILFTWREQHEKYVQSDLGRVTDRISFETQSSEFPVLSNYPPLIRRIVIDKPDGWEFRLVAEIMRHLNNPVFRKFKDLRSGLYVKPQEHISSEEVYEWINQRLAESSRFSGPIIGLIERLNESWGAPGEPCNVDEIHHISSMIRDYLEQILQYEEKIHFANLPYEYDKVVVLMKDIPVSQVANLTSIPDYLDEMVSLIGTDHGGTKENPYMLNKVILFGLPKGWNRKFKRELKRAGKISKRREENESFFSWLSTVIILIVLFITIF